ncbi:AfsR/SARP family transcriptional regulator [Microlunatus soli]|uniref:AfsR/SARP family transcriptional regulator n=1 Tax=Microlunatus soli TaxID=630515 RepID=UPI0015608C7B|nr:BTAD domain-containing putative transcriptional regulator [Microlunatus soli]
MRFDVLGPFRIRRDGVELSLHGRVQRLLLAILLVHPNRPVPADVLIETVWPDDRSGRGQAKLQLAVHRLRARLDKPGRLTLEPAGYRLQLSAGDCDITEFDRLADRLLRPELSQAQIADTARTALDLWRGAAFEDFDELATLPEAARCAERRRWVFDLWCEAELGRGRGTALIPELRLRCTEEPLHERYAVLLIRALHSCGRPADALAVYRRTRSALLEELGVEPGSELQQEQATVLAGQRDDVEDRPEPAPAVRPAQLPPAVELTGRTRELSAVGDADGPALRLITGMGGVGKTSIALAWAHRHADAYPDGQLFVDLRGFSDDPPVDPGEALESCLRTVGVPSERVPAGLQDRSNLLRSLLSSRRVLIVLDNAGSADQVRPLLPGSGPATVIVTSRHALPGLVARDGAVVTAVRPLTRSASVQLLGDLIGNRAGGDTDAVHALAELCGDLPLALRVAAQQAVDRIDQTIAQLVAELGDQHDRLDLLDAGDGPATDVRAILSWSYRSLPEQAAELFAQLGLLPGADADVPALAALSGTSRSVVRRRLDVLVRAHLIDRSVRGRYRQHDLLRAYAAELAEGIDEAPRSAARARLLHFYAHAAATAVAMVRPDDDYNRPVPARSPADPMIFDQPAAAERWLEQEQGNVLAAAHDADPAEAESVLVIAAAYGWRLIGRGLVGDGLRLHTRELELARLVGNRYLEMRALSGIGSCRFSQGDFDGAEAAFEAIRGLHEQHGITDSLGGVHGYLGIVALTRGNLARAEALFCESIRRYRASDRALPIAIATAQHYRGVIGLRAGEPRVAERHFLAARSLCEQHDLAYCRLDVLTGLAETALVDGDPVGADELARQVVAEARARHAISSAVRALVIQGRARTALGDHADGRRLFREATRMVRRTGTVEDTMLVLDGSARAMADGPGALRLFADAIDYAAEHGFDGFQAGLRAELAEILAGSGEPTQAVAQLTRAARIYARVDDPRATTVVAIRDRLAG